MLVSTFKLVSGQEDPEVNFIDEIGDNFIICEDSTTLNENCEDYVPTLPVQEVIRRLQAIQPEVLIAAGFHASKNYKDPGSSTPGCGHWECIIPGPETGKIEAVDIKRSYQLCIDPAEAYSSPWHYTTNGFNLNNLPVFEESSYISNPKVTLISSTTNETRPRLLWRFKTTVNNVQKIFVANFFMTIRAK